MNVDEGDEDEGECEGSEVDAMVFTNYSGCEANNGLQGEDVCTEYL
jgi:hypothetical protein